MMISSIGFIGLTCVLSIWKVSSDIRKIYKQNRETIEKNTIIKYTFEK
jgi:hypothetical protein